MNLEGRCEKIRILKDYDELVLFVFCKDLSQNLLHMIRKVDGEYVNHYEAVDLNFENLEVLAIQTNTFLISYYNSFLRILYFDLFSFEEENGFKFLNYKKALRYEGGILQPIISNPYSAGLPDRKGRREHLFGFNRNRKNEASLQRIQVL